MKLRIISIVSVIALTAALLGCGGGSLGLELGEGKSAVNSMPGSPSSDMQRANTTRVSAGMMSSADSAAVIRGGADGDEPLAITWELPSTRAVSRVGSQFAALPPIPVDEYIPGGNGVKAVTAIQPQDLSSPNDQSLTGVTAAAGSLDLSAPVADMAWAIYEVPLGVGGGINSYQITGTLYVPNNGTDSGLWIGTANYSKRRWEFNGPYDLTTAVAISRGAGVSWSSPGNNAYIALIAWNGDELNIDGLNADVSGGGPGPGVLPDAWETAKANAGLSTATMGMKDIPDFGPDIAYGDFFLTGTEDHNSWLPVWWNAWYEDPEGFPEYVNTKKDDLNTVQSLQDLFLDANSHYMDDLVLGTPPDTVTIAYRVAPQVSSPALDPIMPLAQSIADLVDYAGGTSDVNSYNAAVAALSLADQNALAELVAAVESALASRDAAFLEFGLIDDSQPEYPDSPGLQNYFGSGHGLFIVSHETYMAPMWNVVQGDGGTFFWWRFFRYQGIFEGTALLCDALDNLRNYVATSSPAWASVTLTVQTPRGDIVIGGTGPDTYAPAAGGNGHLLVIDLGGTDTYNNHAGGTASSLNGVSLNVDLGNDNDVYNAIDDPDDMRTNLPDGSGNWNNDNTSQQGAGRMGIGILVDFGGDDQYTSVRLSQGAAVMGSGILADLGGNDSFSFETMGQGAAYGGVGILYDSDGTDDYHMYQKGQGFGGIMGVGYLVDQGVGMDTYEAASVYDAAKPEYSSAQLPSDHPTDPSISNLGQGCGFGLRNGVWINPNNTDPDYTSTVAAGGLGILFDGGGMDTYDCGVFGLGNGFWEACGICIDMDGDDQYNGLWYSQGATAHLATAMLWEEAGNDQYYNKYSAGIGGAHDLSVSWFMERDGNDTYDAAGLDLGSGHVNAFGYFLDIAGDDSYTTHDTGGENRTLGRGVYNDADTTTTWPTYGIFVEDGNGSDTYAAAYAGMLGGPDDTTVIGTPPGNGVAWVRGPFTDGTTQTVFYPLEHGSGLDQ